MAAPSVIRRRASPRLVAPQTNGTVNFPLVDVVGVVGGREHLGFVDVVDAEALQDLSLNEVADAGLGHHRNTDRGNDPLDEVRVAHSRDAALGADVGGHPLQCHDRDGPGPSAIRACSGVTTSMMTPPLSISAMPRLTRAVPVSTIDSSSWCDLWSRAHEATSNTGWSADQLRLARSGRSIREPVCFVKQFTELAGVDGLTLADEFSMAGVSHQRWPWM